MNYEGDFHSTEYTEEGIIVPKVFYNRSPEEGTDKKSDGETKHFNKELIVLDIETLNRDLGGLEILKETGHKIVSEDVFHASDPSHLKVMKMVQRKLSRIPIEDNPEKPLEAQYKPSVPVVQVAINRANTTFPLSSDSF